MNSAEQSTGAQVAPKITRRIAITKIRETLGLSDDGRGANNAKWSQLKVVAQTTAS
jgi:hypothetical protein